jgi:hypothetical protein
MGLSHCNERVRRPFPGQQKNRKRNIAVLYCVTVFRNVSFRLCCALKFHEREKGLRRKGGIAPVQKSTPHSNNKQLCLWKSWSEYILPYWIEIWSKIISTALYSENAVRNVGLRRCCNFQNLPLATRNGHQTKPRDTSAMRIVLLTLLVPSEF